MLTPDQISELHRLHFVEKWPLRKIARHLRIGRRTIGKYFERAGGESGSPRSR
jgi:DNA-binding transcriptional regulator LsrR (DeoR family)